MSHIRTVKNVRQCTLKIRLSWSRTFLRRARSVDIKFFTRLFLLQSSEISQGPLSYFHPILQSLDLIAHSNLSDFCAYWTSSDQTRCVWDVYVFFLAFFSPHAVYMSTCDSHIWLKRTLRFSSNFSHNSSEDILMTNFLDVKKKVF